MLLKTKVKVGNITNLSDARYCAGMGVDMLGFKIGETDRQVNAVKFKEITDWISGPEFILESGTELGEAQLEKYNSKLIELPASAISKLSAPPSDYQFIIRLGLNDWLQFRKDLIHHANQIKYLLVSDSSDVDDHNKKDVVTKMALDFKVLLGFNIPVEMLDEYLSWPIEGLALNGSEETSPGIKDYDHLSSILEKLELD